MTRSVAIIGSEASYLVNFRGRLIADLHARGIKVFALAPGLDAKTRRQIAALGGEPRDIAMARTGNNPLQDARTVLSIHRELRRVRPDAVLSYTIKPVIYGTFAAWLAGVPRRFSMVEGLGSVFIDAVGTNWRRRVVRSILLRLYARAFALSEKVVFLNPDDEAFFRSHGVDRLSSMQLQGIGVDLEEWQPHPPVIEPMTFTYVGRMIADKGVVEFVEAARRVRMRHPQARFVLVGGLDSNPSAIAEGRLRQWAAEGVVEWPGHVPVAPWLAQTSVFVLPSYREGYPRSTQEAMAMARPVLTTDVPGCRETVMDGLNGMLVPPRDPAALADAMERFIAQPELIGRMGAQSRRLAEKTFNVKAVNARLMAMMGVGG
ncbi:MAG: glycosyltransferase family 4 protein [Rhizobiaceae bacterium]